MKNGMLIWNVLLSLVTGFLVITHFTGKASRTGTLTTKDADSLSSAGQFRMAYFEMDSVAANFDLVKEVKTELAKKEDDINREMAGLAKNLQQRYQHYQDQMQAGKMTQAEMDAASAEMTKMDNDLKARKQQLDQEYNEMMVRRQNEIKSKIETFLKDYNKSKNYSYIISYEQGLFYFRDTAFNITADVIKGLNELYKGKK